MSLIVMNAVTTPAQRPVLTMTHFSRMIQNTGYMRTPRSDGPVMDITG